MGHERMKNDDLPVPVDIPQDFFTSSSSRSRSSKDENGVVFVLFFLLEKS
jgi:hypothetical protein